MRTFIGLLSLLSVLAVSTADAAKLNYRQIQKAQRQLEGMMVAMDEPAECRIFWDEKDKAYRIVIKEPHQRSEGWPAFFFVTAAFVVGKYTATTDWKSSSATLIARRDSTGTSIREITTKDCRQAVGLLTAAGKEVSKRNYGKIPWDDCLDEAMGFAAMHITEPFTDLEMIGATEHKQLKAAEFLAEHLKEP